MKKSLLGIGVFTTFASLSLAQTQIGNSSFETWEVVASPDEEPVNWSSFLTASGTLAQFAQSELDKSTDVRPGSSGMYSAHIFSQSVLGVIANGNVTTGRINMGSATPGNPNNYNTSVIADATFSEAITDYPDSLVFWAKYTPVNANDSARVSAILHDNYNFRDPIDAASQPHIVATAIRNFPTTNGNWVRFAVPFTYSGPATSVQFILVTFTTNKVPGGGSGNDQVWIDDAELIYNPNSNTPIIANPDDAVTDATSPVTIPVLQNDFDMEDDIDMTSMTITADPAHGTAVVNTTTGEITYTPDGLFAGTDTFIYQVCDGDGTPSCDTALVSVEVQIVGLEESNMPVFQTVVQNHMLSIIAPTITGTMSVYRSNGQLIFTGDTNSKVPLSETGMYLVRVTSATGSAVRKVMNY